jgi:hypothetical protein
MIIKIPISEPPGGTASDFTRSVKERLDTPYPAILPRCTVDELNALNTREFVDYLVYCINGDSGAPCLAYCNGQAWRKISIGDKVSKT